MQYIDDFILDRINSKKKRLESMLLDTNSLKRIQWNILIEYVFNSNNIEGSSLSLYETRLVLETSRDILARSTYFQHLAINHTNAFEYIRQNVKNPMTNRDILELHGLTMNQIDKEAGCYRKTQRNIDERMESFLGKLYEAKGYHPIEKSAIIQGYFYQTRPCQLWDWFIVQTGYQMDS